MNKILIIGPGINVKGWNVAVGILRDTLKERGLTDVDVKLLNTRDVFKAEALKPKVIVALGSKALKEFVADVPANEKQLRGYVFETDIAPVVATVNPWDINKDWTPWRILFSLDIKRAKEIYEKGFVRPERNVEVVF